MAIVFSTALLESDWVTRIGLASGSIERTVATTEVSEMEATDMLAMEEIQNRSAVPVELRCQVPVAFESCFTF